MLVETRTVTIRACTLVGRHRKNSRTKFNLCERCRKLIIINSGNRRLYNINNRRKHATLLVKNIHKILTCYITQTLFFCDFISCIIIKRIYTVYLFPSRGGCMKEFCVPITILVPMSFCTLSPICIILGQFSMSLLSL